VSPPVDPYDRPRRLVFAATMLLLTGVVAYAMKLLGVLP
jgi:hypothetical protein